MAPSSVLESWFPWAQQPLIISAPMLGVSSGTLAAAVSAAGGLGFIPGGFDLSPGSDNLAQLAKFLRDAAAGTREKDDDNLLPVGVGFITCHHSLANFATTTLPLLKTHRVAAVWLFAPAPPPSPAAAQAHYAGPSAHKDVIAAIRAADDSGWGVRVRVFVQVGTVAAARQAVRDGADVVVAQGGDAGGHQFAGAAGTMGLVPEAVDAVAEEAGKMGRQVGVVAAGGIADGRGVVGAIGLGAQGVVMGTRFIVAKESLAPTYPRESILRTKDSGVTTVKSNFYDDIQNLKFWPRFYDGRAIINASYEDQLAGIPLEENLRRYEEAKEKGDTERMVTWAGTGVGLVQAEQTANEIIEEVREQAKEVLERMKSMVW